jgi:hypothetical protein
VPVVNFFFWIIFMIYLGMNGHKLAAQSRHFENQYEYHGFMKALDHSGKIMFFVAIALIALGFVLGFAGAVGSAFHAFTRY